MSDKSADKSASVRAEARRLPCVDPRAEVGEDVGVGVGPMEFKLKQATVISRLLTTLAMVDVPRRMSRVWTKSEREVP